MSSNHALGHCIHYDPNGFLPPVGVQKTGVCHAGIKYASVRLAEPIRGGGLPIVLPCWREARAHFAADTCGQRCWPTPEQVKAAELETERAMQAVAEGLCPECGEPLEKRPTAGKGWVGRCPAGCDVSVRSCGRLP